jgi:hypothetical protein
MSRSILSVFTLTLLFGYTVVEWGMAGCRSTTLISLRAFSIAFCTTGSSYQGRLQKPDEEPDDAIKRTCALFLGQYRIEGFILSDHTRK